MPIHSQAQRMNVTQGFLLISGLIASLSASVEAHAAPLAVSSQPTNVTLYEGQSSTFSINATSSNAITYQWYKNGVLVGGNSSSLAISNATTSSEGTYSCRVSDGAVTYNCTSFTLTINRIVRFSQQPASVMVNEGSPAKISVAAYGTAPLKYQWFYNGYPISGAIYRTIETSNAKLAYNGKYYCQVSNPGSSAKSTTATLSVMAIPKTASATLKWSQPAAREDGKELSQAEIAGYNLYYSNTSAGSMTKIATLSATQLSYIASNLSIGTHYFAASTLDVNGVESILSPMISRTIQ